MPRSQKNAPRTLRALFARRPRPAPAPVLLESLEERLALYQGPMISGMPPIASLENQFDTVVRIDTNLGKIDIEVFDYTVPTAADNFKKYVNAGKFDEMFFDKLAGGVLQAGKNKFVNGTGLTTIPALPSIPNGFSRSNLARTLAMVPDTSTTTSQRFLINLQDNTALNTQSGGYTVFAKVIQGWEIVQAIAALQTRDLDQQFTGANPNPGPFDTVPVTAQYNPNTGPTEATLVKVIDIEVVKTKGTNRYFEQTLVFPEGFRSNSTIERIDMVNTDQNFANFYQVIVRYETGDRDSVILTGTMAPGQRISLKINDYRAPTYNIVRSGVGYAFEIRTTRGFAASLDHFDNGVTLGESFQLVARVFPGQLKFWNFGGADKGGLFKSYILFQNLTDLDTLVNVLLVPASGTGNVLIPITLKAARRGGIDIQTLAQLANGPFSVQITSNQPIVAAVSEYQLGGPSNLTTGDTAIGTINNGSPEGYLAAGRVPTGSASYIDLYYTDNNIGLNIVDLEFTLSDGTVLTDQVALTSTNRHFRYDIGASLPLLPRDAFFSVRYAARNGTTPVTASYISTEGGDMLTTAFQTTTSRSVSFGDGYTDPTQPPNMTETISVVNPYADVTGVSFFYQLVFYFNDGQPPIFAGGVQTLGPHQRRDHKAVDFAPVLSRINANPANRFYSVQVVSAQFSPTSTPAGGVVAQITRIQNALGQAYTSTPALDPTLPFLFLSDPEFH